MEHIEAYRVVTEVSPVQEGGSLGSLHVASSDPATIIEAGQPTEFLEASAYLYAVIPYVSPLEADTPGEVPIDISPLPGAIVDQVLHQLDEVWALCTKGKIHLPMVDIRPLRTLSPSRFTARLPELAGVVDHCLELVRAMSWSQTEFELRRLEGVHMDSSQAISHAESDLTRARERLRFVECQMTRLITHCAQLRAEGVDSVVLAEMGRLTDLYRHDIKKAAGTVNQKSALLAECSRAYSAAGERFMETVRYEKFRSRKIDACLRSIDDLVRELLQ